MAQIVENRAIVTGTVRRIERAAPRTGAAEGPAPNTEPPDGAPPAGARAPDDARERPAGHAVVVLLVERADDVPGFANLLRASVGTELRVLVREAEAQALALPAGACARCRARRATPWHVYAEPGTLESVDPDARAVTPDA